MVKEGWPGAQNEEKDVTVREGSQPKGRSSGGREWAVPRISLGKHCAHRKAAVNFVSPLGSSFRNTASLVSPGPMSGGLL